MSSDENPHDQGAPDPKEPQGPQEPQSAENARGPQDAPDAQGAHNDSAEQPPQTWSSPPYGGGEYRETGRLTRPAGPSSSKGTQQPDGDRAGAPRQSRLSGAVWLVTLIGSTVYAVSLTLVLFLTTPLLWLSVLESNVGTAIAAPLVASTLAAFLFWVFRRMLRAARFPRPTPAMVLFTVVVLAGFAGSMATQFGFGFGDLGDGLLTAGVLSAPLSALAMLASRGERMRWGAATAAVVMLVAGVLVWNQAESQIESMAAEQREVILGHEDDAAVLDVEGWEPYRSEINDAVHEDGEEADGEDGGDNAASEVPGTGATDDSEWLSVFAVFYQDGHGGYLRSATWADDRTAEDPDAVLRAWCDGEGAYCEELEADGVEGADGPVVAQWGVEGAEEPESSEELGAPQSVRYEYEPGRVVYLGPWTDEPDRSRNGGAGGPEGAQDSDGTQASPDSDTTLGHADFDAQELAGLVTQVRPAEEEDLTELADRTVEYFRSPEGALTGD
ncbi:MATE family efflux transporter [Nocardiopsis salina]|uniref:hypothetical protein n=1 Tax=Nocardiopsis salina TaxID=245836 RepID=UPI00036B7827|nr:hypothetical protein [Nocardiopsis salina]